MELNSLNAENKEDSNNDEEKLNIITDNDNLNKDFNNQKIKRKKS